MTDSANGVEQTYSYSVRATAEGGATNTVDGNMLIQTVCISEVVSGFDLSFNFVLPL